ncbi:MAG TPA: DNA-3-methyladenine glycosylase [Chthoniobacteraceae bacterium]|jgi:DNA-3-methyladenine glycosylase
MLDRAFFRRDPVTCARELIGCELIWNECAGIVVETEAYAARNDEACHTFFRPSARAFIENHETGAAYVYFNYGMYWLLNVLVKGGLEDGFVLIRALEPTAGLAAMRARRMGKRKLPPKGDAWLCSGPGKLAQALNVDGREHGRDLCAGDGIGFRLRVGPVEVVSDVRIGISKAAHLPWRFLLRDSPFVSARATASP